MDIQVIRVFHFTPHAYHILMRLHTYGSADIRNIFTLTVRGSTLVVRI